jgi:dimethylaniline monooxygenase (N-oxide forming)
MKDLGHNPFRKSCVFEEWFVRYKPSDYRTILDEYRNI